MPRVTIIIPAYNKAAWTVKTVQSVLDQTYPDIEIIVVDDGSRDNTKEALAAFGDKIRYVYKENGGACSARNLGIRLAQGEFIGFLDCDDLYLPEKVVLSVQFLKEHPQAIFVHTDAYFIDAHDATIGQYKHPWAKREGKIAHQLILKNFICNSTILVRRKALERAGYFDETIFTPADWDLWLRLSEVGEVGYLNKPLTKYRVVDNYTFNKLELAEKEEALVIDKFFDRNRHLNRFFKRRVKSHLHLRFAQCYFLKNDSPRWQKEFQAAFKENPFNPKTIAFLIYYFAAKESLKADLSRRILRGAKLNA